MVVMGNFEIPALPLSRERSASELHDNEDHDEIDLP